MHSAVIRKRPGSVEGVSEHSSLVENSRVPQPVSHPRRTRGTAVSARTPHPEHRIAGMNRDEEGVKKNPPLPTITVTVAALAIVGWKTRNGAMIATNTAMRSEEVFIASITTACDADSLVQFGKSNALVTFPNCRSALSKRSSLNDQTSVLRSAGLRSEDGTYQASRRVVPLCQFQVPAQDKFGTRNVSNGTNQLQS